MRGQRYNKYLLYQNFSQTFVFNTLYFNIFGRKTKTMRHLTLTILAIFSVLTVAAQKKTLVDENERVILKFDLENETVSVPGMDDFGMFNGYFGGWNEKKGQPYIYGIWVLTSFKQPKPGTLNLRLSYDQGSETQAAELVQTSDTTWTLTLQGTTVIKRAVNRKLVKAPTTYHLKELK